MKRFCSIYRYWRVLRTGLILLALVILLIQSLHCLLNERCSLYIKLTLVDIDIFTYLQQVYLP